MSTPPTSAAGAASMMRLPPSPETTSMAPRTLLPMKHLSIQDDVADDGTTAARTSSRLRSIARYERFQPQAIACSTPLLTNYSAHHDSSGVRTSRGDKQNRNNRQRVGTSVAAIAGPQGVALFRVSRPHTPLVVLSHASSRKTSAVSALSFEPHTKKDSLLLAAARGSNILVWDASGHSLSPLLGRLAMESTLSSSDRITSISWKTSSSSQSLLATTNATSASLWDLRTALRANSSRPSVRLGNARKIDNAGYVIDPLVQVAASNKNEVATLDASGVVHVFDVRMTDRSSPGNNIGEVTSFTAFQHIGIGLESLSTSGSEDTRWVTWGLDATQSDAIVKVYSDRAVSARKDSDADSYWYMDTSPATSPKTSIAMSEASNKSGQAQQYRQVAEFSTPHLACARVCPDPFENRIVTVGMFPGSGRTRAWQAETWKLKEPTENNISFDGEDRGVEKIASFGVLNDRETASMVGTNASMGSLRGAELALESSEGISGLQKDEDGDVIDGKGADLLICCLSEKGYVTTHTVFESTSRGSHGQKGEDASEGLESPRRSRSQGERPFVYSDRTKVFQGDGTQGGDAASMFRVTGDSGDPSDSVYQGNTSEQPSTSGSPLKTDVQYFASGNVMSNDPHAEDETGTQFDMDVPVAYGAPVPGQVVNGMNVTEVASPPVVLLSNEEHAIEVGLQRKDITDTIDKDKVPCPRLCGGSFSPGIGGIVCFNNGEVRKMWSWYEQSDPRRRGHASTGKGRAPLQQGFRSDSTVGDDNAEQGDSSVFNSKPQDIPSSRRQECPRTLKDLQDMTDHARFSQWRSDESSGGESSLDDQSDESLDGSASGDDEEGDGDEARKRMYEKYFGGLQDNILSSPSARESKDRKDEFISPPRSPPRQKQTVVAANAKSNEGFVGPASDLVPAVYITHDQDAVVYSGQSKELALGWMLGGWDTMDNEEEVEVPSPRGLTEKKSSDGKLMDAFWGYDKGKAFPRPHSAELYASQDKILQMSPSAEERMQRVRSDPMLFAPGASQAKNKYGVGSDDDPVHAGVHSKRPNRNESLVFLKKLVTHQRGDTQLQSLMSPPDSPLLPNKMPFGRKKRSSSAAGLMQSPSPTGLMQSPSPTGLIQSPSPTSIAVNESELGDANLNAIPLGVYSLFEEHRTARRAKLREEKLRETCLHNAGVCISLGQVEKANVWNLLAQMAENVLEDEHDSFNGWGGAYGGSLGHDLISSLLQFYESEGDVQMLATMVCVLGGGQRKKVVEGCSLLPMSHQDRYDSFIRRYADLLYRWRLMSERAELRKHLEQRLPDPSGDDEYAAIDITVWCSRCHQEATTDNGVCRQCGSYAFRCSICDMAVRGLFTVCSSCGHGGHTSHLTEWFDKHSVCPTGCGCKCLLVTPMQMGDAKQGFQAMLGKGLGETPELLVAGAGQIPLLS